MSNFSQRRFFFNNKKIITNTNTFKILREVDSSLIDELYKIRTLELDKSGLYDARYGNGKFSNFELELDFKISKGANSGIKYFVDPNLNKGNGSSIGLEYQILDDRNHPDANKKFKVLEESNGEWNFHKEGFKKNRTVGSLYDLIEAENLNEERSKRPVYPETWHRARIIVNNGHVEHWLDNIKLLEYDRFSQVFKALVEYSKYSKWKNFGQSKTGHILLQDHGDEVSFKNIKIREF